MSEAPTEAFGPYLVYEQLGIGGMARVDRAELSGIEGFQRPIALKRMLPHMASNETMVKAFVREARLASYLRHANVAQTYELGKVDDIYFIAMELITGHTLRAVLKHCAQTTGPMPVPIALNLLNQICDALDYAHNLCDETGQRLGIIHRDVSPSNIIVDEAGVAKLIDFGVAKASAAGMQTMSGTIKGKFGYMAPEYILGRIDARIDLFAIGVIAHELLTNRPLFSRPDDMETLQRVRSMEIRPPSQSNPNVPPEIDDVVMTALARDPDRRWQHATALRSALTTVTKRLGLVVHNRQVVEWIAWAFEQTKRHGTNLRRDGLAHGAPGSELDTPVTDEEPSISLEEPPTRAARPSQHGLPLPQGLPPPRGLPPPASSQMVTLMMSGPPEPPASPPLGTPAHAMAAQRTRSATTPAQSGEDPRANPALLAGDEYRAAVAAYARGEALPPAARAISEAGPTLLDPPRSRVPTHATLLDGAAALRSRSPSQSLGVPAPMPPSQSGAHGPSAQSGPVPIPMGAMQSGPLGRPSAVMSSAPPAAGLRPPSAQMGDVPSSARPPSGPMPIAAPPEPTVEAPRSTAMVVVLVLLAAGIAAAAVYFVLPYLT